MNYLGDLGETGPCNSALICGRNFVTNIMEARITTAVLVKCFLYFVMAGFSDDSFSVDSSYYMTGSVEATITAAFVRCGVGAFFAISGLYQRSSLWRKSAASVMGATNDDDIGQT